ncbi:MAG: cell division protein FtsH [Stutzerimonas stutzeri]|nr:MAG: cell division protein FtsH [Stutzerimonas stutzeri]
MTHPHSASLSRTGSRSAFLSARRWLVRNSRRVTLAFSITAILTFSAFYNFPELRGETQASAKVGGDPVSFQTIRAAVAEGQVDRASLSRNSVDEWSTLAVTYKDGRVEWVSVKDSPELADAGDVKLTSLFQAAGVPLSTSSGSTDKSQFSKFTGFGTTVILLVGVCMLLLMMANQVNEIGSTTMGMTGSRVRSKVRFADVAGIEGAKADLEEVVQFIRDPAIFEAVGARASRGILLAGPPGTGKTLLAKAVAGESNAAFLAFSPNDFSSMYIGLGKMKVRNAFARAREQAPAILFIDEIDTLTRKRGQDHREYDAILNEILVQMDGFEGREGVIVIGATNRVDTMDPAILRPGRFDRIVQVPLPDAHGRTEILKVHAQGLPLENDLDLGHIARRAAGYSGAQLENLANEAALSAARAGRSMINAGDFEAAMDKLSMGGRRHGLALSEVDRKLVATHEAGHALCNALLPLCDPIDRVTILPHDNALGGVIRRSEQDALIHSLEKLQSELTVMMAGRAAELVVLGDKHLSSAAAGDNKDATQLALRMTCEWGMSPELGSLYTASDLKDPQVQRAVRHMLDNALDAAKVALTKHRIELDLLIEELMIRETMNRQDVDRVISNAKRLPKAA